MSLDSARLPSLSDKHREQEGARQKAVPEIPVAEGAEVEEKKSKGRRLNK